MKYLGDQIAGADGVLIATPEYNHTLSSVLKNAIEWISVLRPQPFDKKPIYLMSVAASMGGGARA